MFILAIIHRLPFFYDLKELRTKTKAICDVCFALFCIRQSIFCVLTHKFVNWFDQKVVRPDVYPAGPPWKVVRPWPDWPYRTRRPCVSILIHCSATFDFLVYNTVSVKFVLVWEILEEILKTVVKKTFFSSYKCIVGTELSPICWHHNRNQTDLGPTLMNYLQLNSHKQFYSPYAMFEYVTILFIYVLYESCAFVTRL